MDYSIEGPVHKRRISVMSHVVLAVLYVFGLIGLLAAAIVVVVGIITGWRVVLSRS